ncbi:hypothetical protein [Halomonas denitrificans]|nr:hypothetical protein [Halomonas denitrificans]
MTGGTQIGSVQARGQWPVEDGLFQVELNFGGGAFDGSDRFLEITVDGAPLSPRQKITATPYALLATGLAAGSVGGGSVDPTAVQLRVTGTCPPGQYIAQVLQSGNVVCEVDQDSGGTAWNLGGNAGLSAGAYLGTADATPMNIRVDGKRAMRYEWGFSSSGAPNIIGGVDANSIPDTNEASVIAGGGLAGAPNSIVGNGSAIGGGIGNVVDGNWSVIPGGRSNQVDGNDSVAMGRGAQANHSNVFVWNDGGSFASTGPDQFLIDAAGGVGIGTNNPSDQLHISIPSGDAMRVQIGGQTRFRIHDNGGISVGVNSGPPANGLLVNGDIRYSQPRTRWLMLSSGSFVQGFGSASSYDFSHNFGGLTLNEPAFCSIGANSFRGAVQIPHGAIVRVFRAHLTEDDSDANLRIELRRVREDGDWDDFMASIVTAGANSSPRVFEDASIATPVIDNENYAYFVTFFGGCNLGSTTLHSIRIEYELRDVL